MKSTKEPRQKDYDLKHTLCIDPSIKALGWAVFSTALNPISQVKASPNDSDNAHRVWYITSGVLKLKVDNDRLLDAELAHDPEWLSRVDQMTQSLTRIAILNSPLTKILIEMPRIFMSEKGQGASNSGAILKLAFLVGSLRSFFLTSPSSPTVPLSSVELIPVNNWKGTLPKHITRRRIKRHWNIETQEIDHNEADAIGIGDWYFRKFKKYEIQPLSS